MTEFATTTAFRLVRRLAIGQDSTSMYLLVCEEDAESVVSDLRAEIGVQMTLPLPVARVSETNVEFPESGSIRGVVIDQWSPDLVAALDTHVIRIERTRAQFLFITSPAIAERLLVEAPNFRNRLTEVLQIVPDTATEGASC